MKKVIVFISVLLVTFDVAGQAKKHDSIAIVIIDRMTEVIGDLESCRFKLQTVHDVIDPSAGGPIKQFTDYEIYMSGPDKMLVEAHGYKGHRQLMYNGKQLAYYSFDEKNYGMLPAPETTMKTIHQISEQYSIEFPAADFFYPSFTDDLIESSDSLRFLGVMKLNGKEYFHILAHSKGILFQFWVNNDAYNLPAIFAITYKNQPGSPQYLATFSDWQVNPQLPAAMFDFLPPPGAARLRIMAKNEK